MKNEFAYLRHRGVLCFAMLLLLCQPSVTLAAPAPKVACVNNATGAVALRVRCRNSETRFAASAYTTPLNNLTASLADSNTNISTLTSGLATTNTNLSSLSAGLTTTNSNVATLVSGLATTNSTATSLATTVAGQATSIAGLLSSVSTANTDISTLQTTVGTIDATLSPARVYYVAPGGPISSITTAITTAVADGTNAENPAVIYLAPGTYSITSRITVSPGINLVGSGTNATFLVNANDNGVLLMQSDSSAANLLIFDNRAASPRTISMDTANNVALKDIVIEIAEDNDGFAIDVEDSQATIDRVTIRYLSQGTSTVPVRFSDANLEVTQLRIFAFSNTTLTAIRILNAGSITMRNAQIAVTFSSTAATGISNEGSARLTVENSSVAIGENGSGTAVGVMASGGSTVTVRNSSVTCFQNGPSDIGCVHGTGAGTSVNVVHSTIQANNTPNETVVAADSATVTARFSELLEGFTLNLTGGTLTCYGVLNPSYEADLRGNTCFPD